MNNCDILYYIKPEEKPRARTDKEIAETLRQCKRDAIKAAKDIGYFDMFPNLKKEIEAAKTTDNVAKLMSTCRHAFFKEVNG